MFLAKFSDLKDVVSEEFSFRFPGSSPYLTILNTALISVVLTGEVMAPGTYSIRNLTRVTNLLNVAGGLNTNASLREIIIKEAMVPKLNSTFTKYYLETPLCLMI